MTFDALWLKMMEKRPLLADPKATVTISVEAFKFLLKQAHEKGVEQGRSEPSLFDSIFGNFGRKP